MSQYTDFAHTWLCLMSSQAAHLPHTVRSSNEVSE